MITSSESCPVWQRYLEIVAEAGAMPNHIPDKSSLYHRLRAGKQPLVLPPPLSHSYPWYDVVESQKIFAPLDGPVAYELLTEDEPLVDVKERRTAMDMTSAQTFRYSISDVGCP
ncbi:hypothetical protein [Pseudomonas aeruginosa]|uniref:hypothetical protein n=1 Tax=Pseudomonas aeruginosa TaxID=287 RepID=UPI001E5ABC47|nr:hypothetical protein [Pseudomonas aeruginosa]